MSTESKQGRREEPVLRSKRDATRYQILVEIADRQPAVSQREIAEAIGVTAQAVSDYVTELVAMGFVRKEGRGRYEVTMEGVDWLMSRTDSLRDYIDHVTEHVIGRVEIEAAIATTDIEEGQAVSLTMRDGTLRASPGDTGTTTAVAVTSGAAGADIGVTDVEGLLEYEYGEVSIVSVPPVQHGGSRAIDLDSVFDRFADDSLLAVLGTEALVAVRAADREPDIRFGAEAAVQEAAMKGLDVVVLSVRSEVSSLTDRLNEQNISYEVIEHGAD